MQPNKIKIPCKFCSKEFLERGIFTHQIQCKLNPERKEFDKSGLIPFQNTEHKAKANEKATISNWGKLILKQTICENKKCGKTFSYEEREKINKAHRFCSRSCANSREHSIEIKIKISKSAKKYAISQDRELRGVKRTSNCMNCTKEFEYIYNGKPQLCCSSSCAVKYRSFNLKQSFKLRNSYHQKLCYIVGLRKGWATRKITSFPEKFWMGVLENNNILFERELKVGRYFIDFVFPGTNIALEIDGSQHLRPENQAHDKRKDIYLQSKGYDIYRIPWKSINSKPGKEYIKEEIEKFLKYYKSKIQDNGLKV